LEYEEIELMCKIVLTICFIVLDNIRLFLGRFSFLQKNSVAWLPTVVEVRPRTFSTSKANDHAMAWRFAYYPVEFLKFGRFQQQNSA